MLHSSIYSNVESRFEGRIPREEYGSNFGTAMNGLLPMPIASIKTLPRIKDIESFFPNNSGYHVWHQENIS